ncbi:S1C family serine protease [Staphylococcus simulans]|uniref:S1C family serine protease n=1 Tax=Staphylococcus simulans TaxID=1286 RepID=UPI000D1F5B6A|nr:S1C family serine protease [Staphylococcus simulans]PTI96944.1 serine protease [Staphylococcus simulans]UXV36961.1 S1C family serine protease [Staphylococcus simulans]UXV39409.1 S1C family serine protease [Staphylococcus simulans]
MMAEDNGKRQPDEKQVIPKSHYKRKRREFFHNEEREQRVEQEKEQQAQEKEKAAMQAKNNEERVKDNLRKARIEKLTQEEIQHQQEIAQGKREPEVENEQTETPKAKTSSKDESLHKEQPSTSTAGAKKETVKNEKTVSNVSSVTVDDDTKIHEHATSEEPTETESETKPPHKDGEPAKHSTQSNQAKAFFEKHWAKIAIAVGVIILLLLLFAIFHNLRSDNGSAGDVATFDGSGDKQETAMMKAAKSSIHSVVTVENKTKNKSSIDKETANSDNEIGSGVVYKKVDDSIFILTNSHVVGDKKTQRILYDDNKETTGKVIGKDKYSDVAVVKANVEKDSDVKAIRIGDSKQLQLAEPVITVGNPLGADFKGSISNGVVSGLNRNVPVDIDKDNHYDVLTKAFQIDAPVNPGNSGGAVVDQNGKLVGIVSLKIDMPAVEGMAFAIPVNKAVTLAKQLEDKGKIDYPNTGVALSNVADLSDQERDQFKVPKDLQQGTVVREVNQNSPGEKAGLKTGDIIVELDGKKIEDNLRYRQIVFEHQADLKPLSAKIYRNGKLKSITIKLK